MAGILSGQSIHDPVKQRILDYCWHIDVTGLPTLKDELCTASAAIPGLRI
jgi:hypothetical protein